MALLQDIGKKPQDYFSGVQQRANTPSRISPPMQRNNQLGNFLRPIANEARDFVTKQAPAASRIQPLTQPFQNPVAFKNALSQQFQSFQQKGLQGGAQSLGTDLLNAGKFTANAFGGSKMLAGGVPNLLKATVPNALIGGGLNKVMGGSFAEGAGQGVAISPSIRGITGLTNPIIERTIGTTMKRFAPGISSDKNPITNYFATSALRGLQNVPEGAVIDASLGRRPLSLASVGLDFASGFLPGGSRIKGDDFGNRIKMGVTKIENKDAQRIYRMYEFMQSQGNIPIKETQEVFAFAKKYQLDPKFVEKATADQILGELVGNFERYQTKSLPGMGLVEKKQVKGKPNVAQAGGEAKILQGALDKGSKNFTDALDGGKGGNKFTPQEQKLLSEFQDYTMKPEVYAKYNAGAKDPEIIQDFLNSRVAQPPIDIAKVAGTQTNKVALEGQIVPSTKTKVQPISNTVGQPSRTILSQNPTPEQVAATLPNKVESFIQKTLGYSTENPTGGNRGATRYTQALRKGQEAITRKVEAGLGSENALVRNAATTVQNFFRGLGMSPERANASMELRGAMGNANDRAFNVMESLYKSIDHDKGSLERINAVLDPALAKTKVSFDQLTPKEKQVYGIIREGFDLVHDTSYSNGHISQELYQANKGKYTPRLYEVMEMPAEVNKFVTQGKKIVNDLYKQRKTIDEWKIDNSLNDPVYGLGKRLAQVETNTAIKKYTDFLASNSRFVSDVERPGFVQLSDSPAYGALKGKYVLNSAAEDLKGFFFSHTAAQNLYDVFRAYDRMPIRQLQKKLLTVFNPTTNVGNIVSDQVFGFVTGVDPLTLNKNLIQLKTNPSQYKQISDYLMRSGVIGNDITRTDFVNKLGQIDDMAMGKNQNVLKRVANKAQDFYGGTDDVYKAAAFKSLLDKGFSLEEATRKVADGFQNYANVGKYYDVWAKTPVVGSAFIKFQGDLMRIIKNGAVNNPLGLITFLGTLWGVSRLSSKLSGESDADRETRENRFAAPMIPGLNIPLTWQTPFGEINAARYISPFYANNETTNLAKMFPFVPNIQTKKDVASNIAMNANDPLLSTPIQLLVNRDFRGKPISDPNENKYQPSTLTGTEKVINQAKFAGRAYTPPPVNSAIDVGAAAQGKPNMYGTPQTVPQSVARLFGVKVSQYGPKEVQDIRDKDAEFQAKGNEFIDKQINSVKKQVLTGEITQDVANNRINSLQSQKKDAPLPKGDGAGIQYLDSSGKMQTFDTEPSTKGTGIGAFANSDWIQSQAVKLWNTEGIPQKTKNDQFKKWGIDPEDARYAALAGYNTDVSTQYIISKSPDHEKLMENIRTGRVVGITGTQFAANGVIDSLVEQGKLTKAEGTAIKKLKYNKDGTLKTGSGTGKGKKLKKIGAIKTATAKPLKTFKLKLSKAPKMKIKKSPTFKLSKSKKSKTFKTSAIRFKASKRPFLTA